MKSAIFTYLAIVSLAKVAVSLLSGESRLFQRYNCNRHIFRLNSVCAMHPARSCGDAKLWSHATPILLRPRPAFLLCNTVLSVKL